MPASQWLTARQRDFTGGENLSGLPERVARNQMITMENVMVSPSGWLTDVFQSDIITISNATLGMALVPNAGKFSYYAAPGNGTLKTGVFDTASATILDATTGTSTTLAQAYIKGLQHAVPFLGKFYVPNPNPAASSNGVLNLTDKTFIAIAGKISTKLRRWTNRLWVVNSDGTVQASDNGDATTWNPLNIFFLPNQDAVIDFLPIQGGVIVYGRNSVYAMYGSNYQDISFVLLEEGRTFTSGAAVVNGMVFIPSTEGMCRYALNGGGLIPHNQAAYFTSIYSILAQTGQDTLRGIYLQRFKSILVMWPQALGEGQGFIFNVETGAYFKLSKTLPDNTPYLLAINDAHTDFLIGMGDGYYAKSVYPSGVLATYRVATMQTRHEDCDSVRDKVFRVFSITTGSEVKGFSIMAHIDYAEDGIVVAANVDLVEGVNDFFLDIPRGKTISFMMSVDNQQWITYNGGYLTDLSGNILTVGNDPAGFVIKEMKLKYRECGARL